MACHPASFDGSDNVTSYQSRINGMYEHGLIAYNLQPRFRTSLFIVAETRCNRFQNATTLTNFQNATGARVSTQTLRNRLNRAGSSARRLARGIRLQTHYLRERLEWARHNFTWTLQIFTSVRFFDGSSFCFKFTDRRVRVSRMRNEQVTPICRT